MKHQSGPGYSLDSHLIVYDTVESYFMLILASFFTLKHAANDSHADDSPVHFALFQAQRTPDQRIKEMAH